MWKQLHVVIIAGLILFGLMWAAITIYQNQQYAATFSDEDIKRLKENFKITQEIIAELRLLNKANNTRERTIKFTIAPRQPRHVWHKARMIFLEISYLKERKGLPLPSPPHINGAEISPLEVREILDRLLFEVRQLHEIYQVNEKPQPVNVPDRVLALDVYENLNIISYLIDSLESLVVKPKHVYQLAEALVWQANRILKLRNISATINVIPSQGKSPRDVYDISHRLMRTLHTLGKQAPYKVPGGIVLLNRESGHIKPVDVYNCLTNILADMEAIRFALGDDKELVMPALKADKVPSDVYGKVNESLQLIKMLI